MPRFPGPLKTVFLALGVLIFRLLGGRMRVKGRPLLMLTTVGAKSGQLRRTTLGWFPDEDDRHDSWLVVASNGGAAQHPLWYVNLAKHPEHASIAIGQRTFRVRAESLRGDARERAWDRVVSLSPGYGDYQDKTDRQIPIVRLTALGG